MSCEPVLTARRFVTDTLAHIDCQAQSIGAYGFGALVDPNSPVAIALTGLLTLFVAMFGLRMIMGEQFGSRDLIGNALKIGIVLALATSWPVWRTIGYDVVMTGPSELAGLVAGASDLQENGRDLTSRLQDADDNIVQLTVYGTGRSSGAETRSDAIGDSFLGIAMEDQEAFSSGRMAFLVGVIGPMAIVRLGAGIMLALAPLVAGLLLFAGTRDIFFGWLRGLVALAIAAMALTLLFSVELAILNPLLMDAVEMRAALTATPSAPTELLAITVIFALGSFALLAFITRMMFFSSFSLTGLAFGSNAASRTVAYDGGAPGGLAFNRDPPSRAFVVAEAVAQMLRREQQAADRTTLIQQNRSVSGQPAGAAQSTARGPLDLQGNRVRGGDRGQYRRSSASSSRRDQKGQAI